MHLQKRTYSIEEHVLRAFEKSVASGNRSVVITNLLRNYIANAERESIRNALISGAKEMNELYREESEIWNPLEEELYGKTREETSARRHRARPLRSGPRARTSRRSPRTRSLS